MPSCGPRGNPLGVPSTTQVDSGKALLTSENIALVDPSGLSLPPVKVHSLSLLDLDNFRMMLPSLGDGSNPLRSSLEYSEEESTSDESASQRSSFPQWGTNLTSESERQSTSEAYLSQSDARNSNSSASYSGSGTSSNLLDYSEARNINQTFIGSSTKSSNSLSGFIDAPVANPQQGRVLEEHGFEKKSDNQGNACRNLTFPPKEQSHSNRVPSNEYIPNCQSDTMHSVFEDDSDDEDVPYLKKVFTWIPKKSKLDKTQPNMKKPKSRLFKHVR